MKTQAKYKMDRNSSDKEMIRFFYKSDIGSPDFPKN